ncbi:MAG: ProA, partial [Firmicutes bacterium]|nr:ProA [Bacillota bacterium]
MSINELAHLVKEASIKLAGVKAEQKNNALAQIAEALKNSKEEIIAANQVDLRRCREENLPDPLLK